jgi:hypothetical protein
MRLFQLSFHSKLPSFRRRPESSDDIETNTDIAQWHKGLLDSGLRRNDGVK